MPASVVTSFSALSFTRGITGSMRTETGTPLPIRFSAALRRSAGGGAFGSKSRATSASRVVMVRATVDGALLSRSSSRVTRLDLVITWIRQLLSARISRHLRVNPVVASIRGYGSELLDMDTVSPFSFDASR